MLELAIALLLLCLMVWMVLREAKKNAEHWKAQLSSIIGREQDGYLPTMSFSISRTVQGHMVEQIHVQVTAENSSNAMFQLNSLLDRAERMSEKKAGSQEAEKWMG